MTQANEKDTSVEVRCCKGCPDCLGLGYSPAVLKERTRQLNEALAQVAELHARIAKLESTIGAVHEWTLRYGKELSPRGADTYGEGKRDAKEEVRSILKGDRKRKQRGYELE
jgi:hypothetical protein